MKRNCELPLDMINENNQLNDYDFVLMHLYYDNKEYRKCFLNQRELYPERMMILDNSAYEYFVKGETLDLEKFHQCILELKPDYYILPDVLMDKKKTLKGVSDFIQSYGMTIMGAKPLAVAQGNTARELVECIQKYKTMGIDYIGIPFHLSFYKNYPAIKSVETDFKKYYKHIGEDQKYAIGRVSWFLDYYFLFQGYDVKFHMLGSHCPHEANWYEHFQNPGRSVVEGISTMDTGYPVKLALEGTGLYEEESKPKTIIDDFLDKPLDEKTKRLIRSNIERFHHNRHIDISINEIMEIGKKSTPIILK